MVRVIPAGRHLQVSGESSLPSFRLGQSPTKGSSRFSFDVDSGEVADIDVSHSAALLASGSTVSSLELANIHSSHDGDGVPGIPAIAEVPVRVVEPVVGGSVQPVSSTASESAPRSPVPGLPTPSTAVVAPPANLLEEETEGSATLLRNSSEINGPLQTVAET